MIDPSPPPLSFGQLSTDHETHELRVAKLSIGDRLYWIFDRDGFVCSCSTLDELDELLSAEAAARKHPDYGGKRWVWFGVRWKVCPEAVEARRKEMEQLFAAGGGRPSTFTSPRRAKAPRVQPPELAGKSPEEVLAALGLSLPSVPK